MYIYTISSREGHWHLAGQTCAKFQAYGFLFSCPRSGFRAFDAKWSWFWLLTGCVWMLFGIICTSAHSEHQLRPSVTLAPWCGAGNAAIPGLSYGYGMGTSCGFLEDNCLRKKRNIWKNDRNNMEHLGTPSSVSRMLKWSCKWEGKWTIASLTRTNSYGGFRT